MPGKTVWSAVIAIILAILSIVLVPSALAQAPTTIAATLSPDKAFELSATARGDGRIMLEWIIAPGYYLYQDKFGFAQAVMDLPAPLLEGDGQTKNDPTFGVTAVFYGKVAAVLPLAGSSDPVEVQYQGCQEDGICYPPLIRYVDMKTLAITERQDRAAASLANEWSTPGTVASESVIAVATDNGTMVSLLLKDGGVLMVLGSFLVFGFLLAFTPCVFPMYPILAGTIARQGESVTPLRGFTLSFAYVVAMATAFGLLGVVAAWSGQNLQMALQSPFVVGTVSLLFVLLAVSMFGVFELQLPSALVNLIGRPGNRRRGSVASAGLMGFTSALIVGPCVTAPLAGALLYIAQTGDVRLGAASLFALGLGKGIPLIAFGTLGPRALPKAGPWMTAVRQAFGFVFLATAILMVARLIVAEAALALWAVLAIGLGVWLGAFDVLGPDATARQRVAKAAGISVALYGIFLAVGAASGGTDPFRPLGNLVAQRAVTQDDTRTLAFQTAGTPAELDAAVAAGQGKPVLIYVTADWCVTCSMIDRGVLPDPAVEAHLTRFNLIKLDVSDNTAGQRQVMKDLQVFGPPTMIFVDPQGQEKSGTRLIGEVTSATLQASAIATGDPG